MRRTVLIALFVLSSSATARAQVTGSAGDAPRPIYALTAEPSYRGHLILADLGAVAFLPLAATTHEHLAIGWVAGYVLGAPIVHLAHGNGGRAAASLGLRVGVPALGALIGFAIAESDSDSECGNLGCVLNGVAMGAGGAVVGMAAAVLIDWVVLGGEEEIDPSDNASYGFTLEPWSLGVSGRW